MSFTRLAYDAPTYKGAVAQASGPAQYVLGTPWTPTCEPCLSTDVRHHGQGVSTCTSRPMVDIDSELQGITRRASRHPGDKYQPNCGAPYCTEGTRVSECEARGRSEDTRLSNPPCTLRSTGYNRWEWLCRNPQTRVEIPFDFMVNSQLILRDSHRALLPRPIDQKPALPPDDDAPMPGPPDDAARCGHGQVANNLPSVSWRSCAEMARY